MLSLYTRALLAVLPLVLLVAACGTDPTPTSIPTAPAEPTLQQFDSPPPMTIDPDKSYTATLELEKGGEIVIELFAKEAPVTVNNFIFLAREGYYNGVTFHRVIPGFMAQGGDPMGTGSGGPGYTIPDEFSPLRRHDGPGVLSMANVGRPDTGSGQWFITFAATPHLDDAHTVFGQVVEGMDVVFDISPRDPGSGDLAGRRNLLHHHSGGRIAGHMVPFGRLSPVSCTGQAVGGADAIVRPPD